MSPMQRALGPDWSRLPPALQAHHSSGQATDRGHMDIEYPSGMQPVMFVLARLGALLSRKGRGVKTTVVKQMIADRQHWRRTMEFADGRVLRFDSVWVPSGPGCFIEYVNPCLGLELRPVLVGRQLHFHGVRFVVQLGRWRLSLPQWLGPGSTRIVEEAVDERRFEMDFRLTHPWFGQLFRYAGQFTTEVARSGREEGHS